MPAIPNAGEVTRELRKVRQARLYEQRSVPREVLDELLEVARWSGCWRNILPLEFIVI